jgi:hypothetical protein
MPYNKLDEGSSLAFEGDEENGFTTYPPKRERSYLYFIICGIASLLAGGVIGGYLGPHLHILPSSMRIPPSSASSTCKSPVVRREWRSLSNMEKHDYLDAVRCLKDVPSRIGESQSLYDDFPWIHYRIGDYCK